MQKLGNQDEAGKNVANKRCCGQAEAQDLAKFELKIFSAGQQNIYFFLLFLRNFCNFFVRLFSASSSSSSCRCHVLRDPGEVLGMFW